jgi:hypothetical protein
MGWVEFQLLLTHGLMTGSLKILTRNLGINGYILTEILFEDMLLIAPSYSQQIILEIILHKTWF